ncbi:hypothetical protein AGMMS49982_00310 [Bacteroidia bacterium]|nr:hypothetical protein AGMMS49982_00310 [Bacteroidia bacterium]
MKKKLLMACMMMVAIPSLFSQEPPKPAWMDSPPSARGYNFFFSRGSGSEMTAENALKKAFTDAYIKGMQENGLTSSTSGEAQTLSEIEAKGVNAFMQFQSTNGLALKIYCEELVKLSSGRFMAYVLLQMARSAAQSPRFEDADDGGDICQKQYFAEKKEAYHKLVAKEQKKQRRQISTANLFKGNSYLFWDMIDLNYPAYWGMGISGRFGGIFGVGFKASAGLDIGSLDFSEWGYDLGFRVYPYKGLFLSGGYGTFGLKKGTEFNESDGRWGTNGYRQNDGIKMALGYDWVPDDRGTLPLISFSAGVGYDAFMKSLQPLIGITIGIGGKL